MWKYLIIEYNISTNKHRYSIKLWKLIIEWLEQITTYLLVFIGASYLLIFI